MKQSSSVLLLATPRPTGVILSEATVCFESKLPAWLPRSGRRDDPYSSGCRGGQGLALQEHAQAAPVTQGPDFAGPRVPLSGTTHLYREETHAQPTSSQTRRPHARRWAGWRQAPRTPQFYLSQGTERCLVASIQWGGLETDCLGPLPAHHQSWAPGTVRTSVCKSRASQGRGHSGVGGGISARGHELSVLSANNNDDDDRSTDTSA